MLLIFTPQKITFEALTAQLPVACRHAEQPESVEKMTAEDTAIQGIILAPDDLTQLDSVTAAKPDKPMLLLLPLGETTAPFDCPFLPRPCSLAAFTREADRLLAQSAAIDWPGVGRFDPATLRLTGHGQTCNLTERESELLRYLQRQTAETPKETLLREVWKYHPEIDSHTLESTLYRLRAKLAETLGEHVQICNNEQGYYLKVTA